MSSNENSIRSRLRSSKVRPAAAPRVVEGPRNLARSSRNFTALAEPTGSKSDHLIHAYASHDASGSNGRPSRPVRACTLRSRAKIEPKPTAAKPRVRNAPSKTGNKTGPSKRKRQVIVSAPREVEVQGPPPLARLPEARAETEELFEKLKESNGRLMKEFSPVSYTDIDFLSSLYVDLASDDNIARFLLEPESGFAIVEEEDKVHIMKKLGAAAEAEVGDDERDADSDYPESEDEEGAQYNEEDLARPAPYPRGRWTQVPLHSTAATSEISAALTRIMKQIVDQFDPLPSAGVSRTVVDTSASGEIKTRPDIVIRAKGPSFEVPSTRDQRILQTKSEQENSEFIDLGYTNAASVIEVRREAAKGKDKECIAQLGAFCSEIWAHQPNRHFVRALLLTESTVRLIHCDRAGTYITPVFNYHTNPYIFVRLVLGLTSTDENVLGFDTSIKWRVDHRSGKKASGTITIVDEDGIPIVYNMQSIAPTFVHRSMRGRGTTCWSVKHPGKDRDLIIKDAWRTGEGASERVYLEATKELPGVARMVSWQDALAETDNSRPNSYRGRGQYQNHMKLRIVMEAYGDTVLNYKTRYQLISALKDAIRGHHELVKKRILHRDVSAGNILLGDDDQEGLRGFLIDLDMAIWMDENAPATASAA